MGVCSTFPVMKLISESESAKCQQGCRLHLHSSYISRNKSIKQYQDESVIQASRKATYKFLEIM